MVRGSGRYGRRYVSRFRGRALGQRGCVEVSGRRTANFDAYSSEHRFRHLEVGSEDFHMLMQLWDRLAGRKSLPKGFVVLGPDGIAAWDIDSDVPLMPTRWSRLSFALTVRQTQKMTTSEIDAHIERFASPAVKERRALMNVALSERNHRLAMERLIATNSRQGRQESAIPRRTA